MAAILDTQSTPHYGAGNHPGILEAVLQRLDNLWPDYSTTNLGPSLG